MRRDGLQNRRIDTFAQNVLYKRTDINIGEKNNIRMEMLDEYT